ncbi:major facilitator superfamily domain-containing protein [Myxozyma melibiosi]|uniref:Major facilitator superfamily domain-containing protein n=1 Tax=Myxozyma melibiosi TaxID=54550 RepID=A0ABR1F2E8_9ASCO
MSASKDLGIVTITEKEGTRSSPHLTPPDELEKLDSIVITGEIEEDDEEVNTLPPQYGYQSPDSDEYILSPHELYRPDRGWRAWLCVLGGFFGTMSTFGFVNVMGVFEQYYKETLLKDYSTSQISWISSIQTFIMTFGALVIGPMYDVYGPKKLMLPGALVMVLGVMMTSLCTKYWQLILAQSLCTSFGATLLFNPVLSSVSGWFVRRRAAAMGITTAGASTGGVILPILFRKIEARSGFGWGVRSMGFFVLGLSMITCATVTTRVKPPGKRHVSLYDTYISPFKWTPYALTALSAFCVMLGAYVPVNYLSSFGQANGFSPDLASYLSSILNGASTFGRILPGIVADKLGKYNTFFLSAFLTGTLAAAFWIPITTHPQIIAFAAVYGFVSGAALTVWQAVIGEISPMREMGARLGMVNAFTAFATLVGSPIAGAIQSSNHGKYWGMAIFTSANMIGGACLAMAARLILTDFVLLKKK